VKGPRLPHVGMLRALCWLPASWLGITASFCNIFYDYQVKDRRVLTEMTGITAEDRK